jgi:uncharacterized membrane protein
MAIIPISLFLTASFFVLFTLRKVTDKWLKLLGYSAVTFLLLAALVVFLGSVANLARGLGGKRYSMAEKMKMCGMMQDRGMPGMPMPGKGVPAKE